MPNPSHFQPPESPASLGSNGRNAPVYRRGLGDSMLFRATGVVVLLILVGAAAYFWLKGSPEEPAAPAPQTDIEYAATKPGGDAAPPDSSEIEAMTTSPDEIAAEDRGPDNLIPVKAELGATDLVDNLKDLSIGQKFNVKTATGVVTLSFNPASFRYEDCKVMVVVTDPTGKELQTIKGLTRDAARRKMLEINDAEHNVEAKIDPDAPAKFVSRERDFTITVPGDPAVELNDGTKNAFQIDRTFYLANPVKK